jgi:hypothetical protein
MKHCRASIPLKFLVTLIIALLIFIPTILWACNLFRTSEEASNSYNGLVEAIKKVIDKPAGTVESFVLKMDEKTAIISFGAAQNNVYVGYWDPMTKKNFNYSISKPSECTQTCICLCKRLVQEKEEIGGFPLTWHGYYTCEDRKCDNLGTFNLSMKCEYDEDPKNPNGPKSFKCSDGVLLERNFVFTQPRDRAIYAHKVDTSTMVLCTETEKGMCI